MITLLLKNYKLILIAILVLAIGALFTAWRIDHERAIKFKDQAESLGNYHSNQQDSLKTSKNDKNQWEAVTNANLMTAATVQRLAEAQGFWINDVKGVKKNMKNLESAQATQLSVGINTKVPTIETLGDSTRKTIRFKVERIYDDKNFTKAYISTNQDSGTLDLDIAVSVKQAVYWDRKWFLGKKKYYSKVISENPDVKINAHESITVTKKK